MWLPLCINETIKHHAYKEFGARWLSGREQDSWGRGYKTFFMLSSAET